MVQEIRPFGSGWPCCDGNCGDCYKNKITYSNFIDEDDENNN
jgi:hypothetical protein